jgi:hypothetical protein
VTIRERRSPRRALVAFALVVAAGAAAFALWPSADEKRPAPSPAPAPSAPAPAPPAQPTEQPAEPVNAPAPQKIEAAPHARPAEQRGPAAPARTTPIAPKPVAAARKLLPLAPSLADDGEADAAPRAPPEAAANGVPAPGFGPAPAPKARNDRR